MAVQLVLRNGTDTENNSFTGAQAELTVDTTNNNIRIHDGSTPGGISTATVTGTQTLSNKTLDDPSFSGQITGDLIPSSDITFDLGSPTNRWNDLYLSGNTIDIGGSTISVDVNGNFEFKDSTGNASPISLSTIDTTGDATIGGNATITGDLTVNGATTTINTTTLNVEDLNITVASGATDSASADGAGLTVDGANATLVYTSSSDRFVFNKNIEATSLVGQVTDISNHTTDDLLEGTGNLYYTDTRVRDAVSATTGLDYNSATGNFALADTAVTAGSFGSSSDIPVITVDEQGRITSATTATVAGVTTFGYDSITGDLDIGTADGSTFTATVDLGPFTTADLTEGTNLYYTDARVRGAISASTGIDYTASTGDFALADTAVTAGTFGSSSEVPVITIDQQGRITSASTSTVAGVTSFTYDSTTAELDINTADGSTFTSTLDLGPFNTSDLAEGTNLYYTDARVDAHLVGGAGIDFSAGTIAHTDTSSQTSVSNTSGTVIQDVTLDDFGHVTALASENLDNRYYTQTTANSTFVDVAGDTMTGFLTLHADPTANLHAATKRYVDEVAQGLQAKPADDVATTANLSATYDNGTSGVGATLTASANGAFPTIDGYDMAVGETILVKDQNTLLENGSYELTDAGSSTTPWVLTRAEFVNETNEIRGAFEFVTNGTTLANTGFVATVPEDFVIGSSDASTDGNFTSKGDIEWVQFSGAGTFTAGSGLVLSGNEFAHEDTSSVTDVTSASNTFVDAITFDTFGHVQSISTSTAAPPNDATITIAAGSSLSGGGNFTTDQSSNETITIDHGDTSTLSGTYGSTANGTKIDNITVDSNGHVTGVTTGVTGDILEVNTGSGLTGGGTSGSVTVSHADTSSVGNVTSTTNTFIDAVSFDTFGHVQSVSTSSVTPPNDASITINAGGGLTSGGTFTTDQSFNETITIDHANTSSQSSINNSGNTVIQDISVDTYGHVTSIGSTALSIPAAANNATITLSAGSGLTGGGNFTTDQSGNETITVNHADTSSQGSVNGSGNTFIQDVTLDGFGHVTGLNTNTLTTSDLGLDSNDSVQHGSLGIGTSATGVSGEIVATGDITSNASDDRLKNRLGGIENALHKVESLSGFYFEFNNTAIDLGLQKGKRVGVSAQEVQSVLPEVVRDSPVGDEYLTVQYEKLVPLLIEAIKEQSSTIEDLKSRINTLEDR